VLNEEAWNGRPDLQVIGKPTAAWYALSEEEQRDLLTRLDDCNAQVGGKQIILCDSAWADETWSTWGVDEYPNIEAVQKLDQLHQEMNWFRYWESTSRLGTKWESPW
jgi:hypothetical protein